MSGLQLQISFRIGLAGRYERVDHPQYGEFVLYFLRLAASAAVRDDRVSCMAG
jgi:hypothetical protein